MTKHVALLILATVLGCANDHSIVPDPDSKRGHSESAKEAWYGDHEVRIEPFEGEGADSIADRMLDGRSFLGLSVEQRLEIFGCAEAEAPTSICKYLCVGCGTSSNTRCGWDCFWDARTREQVRACGIPCAPLKGGKK